MDVSRRGFLLGAIKTGALAILPIPLLKAAPVEEIIVPEENGLITTDMELINTGGLERTHSNYSGKGIFFNNRFISTQNIELNSKQDFVDDEPIGGYRTYKAWGSVYTKLQTSGLLMWEEPYEILLNGDVIKIDILSGNTRYTGDFIMTKYTLSSGVY